MNNFGFSNFSPASRNRYLLKKSMRLLRDIKQRWISKMFNFFEENGLIITYKDGRERFAELVPGVGDSSVSKTLALPYAKVENEYTSWLEHQPQKNFPTKTKEIPGNCQSGKMQLCSTQLCPLNTCRERKPQART